jgi:hypothetical protein
VPPTCTVQARDDSYMTARNTTLTVRFNRSVWRNDDRCGFGSRVLDGPDHGTVVLQLDGTFVYTPHRGFVGVDTFTYVLEPVGPSGFMSGRPDAAPSGGDPVALVTITVVGDGLPATR